MRKLLAACGAGMLAAASAVAFSLPASATAGQRSGQPRMTHLTAAGAQARSGRFTLLRETHNPDGSVVAVWRGRKGGRLYYLGPPRARISLHEAVVRTRAGKRMRQATVGVRIPGGRSGWTARVAPREGGMRGGQARAGSLGAQVQADALLGGLPPRVARSFARSIGAVPQACNRGCHRVDSTCLKFFDQVNVAVSGCDNRYKLQKARHNNYIGEDIKVQVAVAAHLFVALKQVNVHTNYTSRKNNTITDIHPSNPKKTNCHSGGNFSVTWFHVTFSAHLVLCGGTMSTYGLAAHRGGAIWTGNLKNGTLLLDPQLQDHDKSGINPGSTFFIHTESTGTSKTGQCKNGHTCG